MTAPACYDGAVKMILMLYILNNYLSHEDKVKFNVFAV